MKRFHVHSDKYWTVDPQGLAWETFHTLGSIPVFGENAAPAETPADSRQACCVAPVEAVRVTLTRQSRCG